MSNETELVKKCQKFVHASQCKIRLSDPKPCKKCLAKDARLKERYSTHRGHFYHYVICHSGIDFDVDPRLDQCIDKLVAECEKFQEKNQH